MGFRETDTFDTIEPAEHAPVLLAQVPAEKVALAKYEDICQAIGQLAESGALRYSWANGQMNRFYTDADGAEKLAAMGMHIKKLPSVSPTKYGFPLGTHHFQIEPRTLIASGGAWLSPAKYSRYLESRATAMMLALDKAKQLDSIPANELNYKVSEPDRASIVTIEQDIVKNRELAKLVPVFVETGAIRVTEAKGDMPMIIHATPDAGKLLRKAGANVSNLGMIGSRLLKDRDTTYFGRRIAPESILDPEKFSEDQLKALKTVLADARQLPKMEASKDSKYMQRF